VQEAGQADLVEHAADRSDRRRGHQRRCRTGSPTPTSAGRHTSDPASNCAGRAPPGRAAPGPVGGEQYWKPRRG
jgi:hypothetical protein